MALQVDGSPTDLPIDQYLTSLGIINRSGVDKGPGYYDPAKWGGNWLKYKQTKDLYEAYDTQRDSVMKDLLGKGYTLRDLGLYNVQDLGKAAYGRYGNLNAQALKMRAGGFNPGPLQYQVPQGNQGPMGPMGPGGGIGLPPPGDIAKQRRMDWATQGIGTATIAQPKTLQGVLAQKKVQQNPIVF